jgi:hypothetical protein
MAFLANRASQLVLTLALTAGLLFQVRVEMYQSQFDKEKNPVRRAKMMDKLGDLQFEQLRADLRDDDFDRGMLMLNDYLKDCVSVHQALKEKDVDPERKPDGFKQLQVSVRSNLQRLDDMLAGLDSEERKPFLTARRKLDELNKQLIHELFPRQPDAKESK